MAPRSAPGPVRMVRSGAECRNSPHHLGMREGGRLGDGRDGERERCPEAHDICLFGRDVGSGPAWRAARTGSRTLSLDVAATVQRPDPAAGRRAQARAGSTGRARACPPARYGVPTACPARRLPAPIAAPPPARDRFARYAARPGEIWCVGGSGFPPLGAQDLKSVASSTGGRHTTASGNITERHRGAPSPARRLPYSSLRITAVSCTYAHHPRRVGGQDTTQCKRCIQVSRAG